MKISRTIFVAILCRRLAFIFYLYQCNQLVINNTIHRTGQDSESRGIIKMLISKGES